MSRDRSYDMERRPGTKRKALESLHGEPKKLKREQDYQDETLDMGSENPDLLKDEIDNLQRELDMLDAELKKQGTGDQATEYSRVDEADGEIQVDDEGSRGAPPPRTRSSWNYTGGYNGAEENNHSSGYNNGHSNHTQQPVTRRPPSRPSRATRASIDATAASNPPAPAAGGRVRGGGGGTGGGGRGARGKWKPLLPAPSWPVPRKGEVVTPGKKGQDAMTICSRILKELVRHKHSWVFLKPVDAHGMGLHDYHKIVKRPMDLGTIQSKLTNSQYSNVTEFADDVRLTFRNAMLYNPATHDVHVMAKTLLQLFEKKIPKAVEVESEDPSMRKVHLEQNLNKLRSNETKFQQQLDTARTQLEQSKTTEISDISPAVKPRAPVSEPTEKKQLTEAESMAEYDEKCKLAQNINTLGLRFMKGLFQIFEEEKPEFLKSNSEIIDVETDRLPQPLLRRLIEYVSDCRAIEQQMRAARVTTNNNNNNTVNTPSMSQSSSSSQSPPTSSEMKITTTTTTATTTTTTTATTTTKAQHPTNNNNANTNNNTNNNAANNNANNNNANNANNANNPNNNANTTQSTQGGKKLGTTTAKQGKEGEGKDKDSESSSSSSDSSSSDDSSEDSDEK